jgi:hypothetical protein
MADQALRAKLAETIGPMLTPNGGLNAGLVGRATRKKAEAIADAVIARIHDEGLSFYLRWPGDDA